MGEMKEIKFNNEATSPVLHGMNQVAEAVKTTFGPHGRNVIIEMEDESPHITKDGVTVATSISLPDSYENIGAQLIKDVALKTCKDVGDGTTTSTILTQFIVNLGLRTLGFGGNVFELKKGMELATRVVVEHLKAQAVHIDNREQIFNVAMISTNGDVDLSNLLADTFEKIGKDGVVIVEDNDSGKTEVNLSEGLQIKTGYYTPLFCTSSPVITLENVHVIVSLKKIENLSDIVPQLQNARNTNNSVLLIAPDFSGPVLASLIANNAQGVLKVCAVKAPGFNEQQLNYLEDITVFTGSSIVGKAATKVVGKADKVIIKENNTTIMGGAATKEDVQGRIDYLVALKESTKVEEIKNRINERIARLKASVAFLYVGADSEVELKEKKDRIDDAVNAIKAALDEGVVMGSGIALLRASRLLYKIPSNNESYNTGLSIIRDACKQVITQLLNNANLNTSIIDTLIDSDPNTGYNIMTQEYENLVEKGIVDPVKVVYSALLNSVSVASMFLTTNCVIINKK